MKTKNEIIAIRSWAVLRNLTGRAALTLLAAATIIIPLRAAETKTIAAAAQFSTSYKTVKVNGLDIFYREAGPANAPTLILLHGFPTSSHMFRNLIPALDRKSVV